MISFFGGGKTLVNFKLLIVFICLASPATAADKLVKVVPGSGGDLQISRLYSVDYQCKVDPSRQFGVVQKALGLWDAGWSKGTVNENVSVYSTSPASAPTTTGATGTGANAPVGSANGNLVFSTNAMTFAITPIRGTDDRSIGCRGQFFVSGSENFRIDAQVGINTTNQFGDIVSKVATLAKTTVSSVYALFRAATPTEFGSSVTASAQILQDYDGFRKLFSVDNPATQTDAGELRIGNNWIVTYDSGGNVVSSLQLYVQPVVSLVMDGHTKFLATYNASAVNVGITVTGDEANMRSQCSQQTQVYYTAGITDDRDIAFLLYRRLLVSFTAHQKIAQCMGLRVAKAALGIINKVGRVADDFLVTPDDVKNLTQAVQSEQPHDRPTLASDMDSFLDQLDRHLQSRGLRGDQLSKLTEYFAPDVRIEDTTADYKALALMAPKAGANDTGASLKREDLLATFRTAGLLRWLCVQRTKQAVAPALPLYDPAIDSAVMVVAAKASANDTLDKNKSQLFGVHIKFNKAFNSEPLVINKLIFEERLLPLLLKDNPACIPAQTDQKKDVQPPKV